MNRKARTDLLLKMNGLRRSSRMSWGDIAEVYESEAGEKVDPEKLRVRVKSCVYRNKKRRENSMILERIEDAAAEPAEARCCEVGARASRGVLKRIVAWFRSLFGKDADEKIVLDWAYGNCNGSKAVEDTSASGYRLTKFTFDGKTVKFDGVGSMWGYTHDKHDARNCLFFRDGVRYVGGFFEWGDPSRKSREIKNITGRYGGWDPSRLARASEFAFCITDKAGKKRTNVLTFKR